MKKIYCELHMFDLHQNIFVIDDDGTQTCVAIASMEELPEVISAISDSRGINKIILTGNTVFGKAVSEDIIAYSKMHYSYNNIEVEVMKR